VPEIKIVLPASLADLAHIILRKEWKTTAGGGIAGLLALATMAGIHIPGVPIDPNSVPELLGLAVLGVLGKDGFGGDKK
jgi:hypothetical protein